MFQTHGLCWTKVLPAWKSMPTARDVPDTGTSASDLSNGSNGIPRMPSCTEYSKKEPTPTEKKKKTNKTPCFYHFHQFLKPNWAKSRNCAWILLTLTRLLPRAQAVSGSAHAGSGGRGGGETQLGTVSVVITAEIGAWEHISTRTCTQNVSKRGYRDINRCTFS